MFNVLRRLRRKTSTPAVTRPRKSAFALELPNPCGGKPWLSATLALSNRPQGRGETVRLRAHVDGCLRLSSQADAGPALADDADDGHSQFAHGRRLMAGAVRQMLERLPEERLAPLTRRRWRSWVDVQVSTAPLDKGAEALVPEQLRDRWGAGPPLAGTGKPRIGAWSGPAGGPRGGRAGLVWLQLDGDDVAGGGQARTAASGLHLNASACRLVEPDSGAD